MAISSNTHKIEGLLSDAQLGDNAILLRDSDLVIDPFKKIDEAILRILSQPPDSLDRHRESCQVYSRMTQNAAAVMFQAIAALNRGSAHATRK